VGLRHGSAGTILFGIHDTPYKLSTGKLDPFGDKMGDYNAIIGNVGGTTNFDVRAKDTVAYLSPSWGGVSVNVARSVTGSESSNSGAGNANLTSASIAYDAKPVYAAVAYEVHKNGYTSWDSDAFQNTGMKIGVGASFGDTKIGAVYEKLDDDKQGSDKTRDAMYLSLSQTFGKETINLAYGSADDGDNAATKTGATLIAVGIDHKLSKRTIVYLNYSAVDNEENATYAVGTGTGGSYKPAAGKDPSAFSLGVIHTF
jgi:predicted porin